MSSKQTYIPKNFSPKHEKIIVAADEIMRSYARAGYDLSLRQLYYQFIAHRAHLFPGNGPNGSPNTEQNYKMLGNVISDARNAGELDWDSMVDRGRATIQNPHWEGPSDFIGSVARQYRHDLWLGQEYHVEVMVEKQALEGVIRPVCRRLDVPFTSNKGYSSSSAMRETGVRLKNQIDSGKKVVILYLGDHDPSGIDMTRDVEDRLLLYSEAGFYTDDPHEMREFGLDKPGVVATEWGLDHLKVERIALEMDQIRSYNPPPNPTKVTDSRAKKYIEEYGHECWELDALEPSVMASLVENSIEQYLDRQAFDERVESMNRIKAGFEKLAATIDDKTFGADDE